MHAMNGKQALDDEQLTQVTGGVEGFEGIVRPAGSEYDSPILPNDWKQFGPEWERQTEAKAAELNIQPAGTYELRAAVISVSKD